MQKNFCYTKFGLWPWRANTSKGGDGMDEKAKQKIGKIIILLILSITFLVLGIGLIINTVQSDLDLQSKTALYSISGTFTSIGLIFLKKI